MEQMQAPWLQTLGCPRAPSTRAFWGHVLKKGFVISGQLALLHQRATETEKTGLKGSYQFYGRVKFIEKIKKLEGNVSVAQ